MTHGPSRPGDHEDGDLPARLPARWPLHGRQRELELAVGALARSHGAVLAGQQGVGKTRLAQEILEVARHRGHPTQWAVATRPARSIAFGALAHLVPAVRGGASNRLETLQRALGAMSRSRGDRSLVLGVDDAHLLDDASAALVHLAASTSTAIVVATTQTAPTAQDVVTTLWKEGLAERIELLPLTQEETAALAAEVLGGELDLRTAHRLWQTTRGNPLYLRELLLAGVGGGHLRRSDRVWRWRGPIRVGSRLTEVVQRRLGELGTELREALEILAVAQPLELALLEALTGAETVLAAEQDGVVTISRDGRRSSVQLAHPLYADVLREGTPHRRTQRVMARLAAALEATGARREGDSIRVCDWRLQAGLPIPPDVLLAGAMRARAAGDWAFTERLLDALRNRSEPAAALLILGDTLHAAARWSESAAVLARIDLDALPESHRIELLMIEVENLGIGQGRVREAEALVERVARGMPPEPWLDDLRAHIAILRGEVAEAVARPPGGGRDPATGRLRATAVAPMAYGLGISGDVEAALAVVEEVLADPGQETVAPIRRWLGSARLWIGLLGGHLDRTELGGLYDAALAASDQMGAWIAAVFSGMLAVHRGQAAAARQWAAELAGIATAIPPGSALALGLSVRVRLLALVGEADEAAAVLAAMEAARHPEVDMFEGELARARSAVAAVRGDLEAAGAVALEAAARADRLGQRVMALVHLYDAACFGAVTAAAERVRGLVGRLTGPLPPVMVEHLLAWGDGDAGRLASVADAYEAIGANLLAAEAAVVALRFHRGLGRRSAPATRAALLLERCLGCHTPVLDARPPGTSLTAREHEVALLAGQGLTNGEIAVRLGISRRTVETHLARAYDKLGATSRDQLGPATRRGRAGSA